MPVTTFPLPLTSRCTGVQPARLIHPTPSGCWRVPYAIPLRSKERPSTHPLCGGGHATVQGAPVGAHAPIDRRCHFTPHKDIKIDLFVCWKSPLEYRKNHVFYFKFTFFVFYSDSKFQNVIRFRFQNSIKVCGKARINFRWEELYTLASCIFAEFYFSFFSPPIFCTHEYIYLFSLRFIYKPLSNICVSISPSFFLASFGRPFSTSDRTEWLGNMAMSESTQSDKICQFLLSAHSMKEFNNNSKNICSKNVFFQPFQAFKPRAALVSLEFDSFTSFSNFLNVWRLLAGGMQRFMVKPPRLVGKFFKFIQFSCRLKTIGLVSEAKFQILFNQQKILLLLKSNYAIPIFLLIL